MISCTLLSPLSIHTHYHLAPSDTSVRFCPTIKLCTRQYMYFTRMKEYLFESYNISSFSMKRRAVTSCNAGYVQLPPKRITLMLITEKKTKLDKNSFWTTHSTFAKKQHNKRTVQL